MIADFLHNLLRRYSMHVATKKIAELPLIVTSNEGAAQQAQRPKKIYP